MPSCADGRTTWPADSGGSRKIEGEVRESNGGWERVITKRDNMKENIKMTGRVGRSKSKNQSPKRSQR